MKFAFVGVDGGSLSMWLRLQDEGHDVGVHIIPRNHRTIGDGLVQKFEGYEALLAWGGNDAVYVFDSSGFGEKADALRQRGCLVLGGGKLCDRLEKDRAYGEKVAQTCGMLLPESKRFSTIAASCKFLKEHAGHWFFKSDKYLESGATKGGDSEHLCRYLDNLASRYGDNIPNIIQEKINGTPVSTGAWFDGRKFLKPYEKTIEHKAFLNGDLGPATGCSLNVVWFAHDGDTTADQLHFPELEYFLRKSNAPPGIYDVNAVVSKGKPYFLEWTNRFGYDSEPTGLRALTIPLGEFFHRLTTGGLMTAPFDKQFHMAVRVGHLPYPVEYKDIPMDKDMQEVPKNQTAEGIPIAGELGDLYSGPFVAYGLRASEDGGYEMGDRTGIVGLAAGEGKTLRGAGQAVAKSLEGLDIPDPLYRTDYLEVLEKDYKALESPIRRPVNA